MYSIQKGEHMLKVAAAIIENRDGLYLIARRKQGKSQAGLWEFPGGKIELKESAEDCLRRELHEEMNIEIEPYQYFGEHIHDYGTVVIQLIAYRARFVQGEINLIDHDQYLWVQAKELPSYEFAPADIPFVRKLTTKANLST